MYLRTWEQKIKPIMQPIHCDLQTRMHQGQKKSQMNSHSCCRTEKKNRLCSERPQLQRPRAHSTCHCQLQALYTKKMQAFVLRLPPKHNPRRHLNAFCSFTWLTRISGCTWQEDMATMMRPFYCDPHQRFHTHRELSTDE